MTPLLDLDIDAACWEFIAQRIVTRGGNRPPQPIVGYLDNFCDTCEADPCVCRDDEREPDELPEPDEPDPWDALTARAAFLGSGPETVREMTERRLAKMGE